MARQDWHLIKWGHHKIPVVRPLLFPHSAPLYTQHSSTQMGNVGWKCGQLLCRQCSTVDWAGHLVYSAIARLHLLLGSKIFTWFEILHHLSPQNIPITEKYSPNVSVCFNLGNKNRCYQPVDTSHPSLLLPPYIRACSVHKSKQVKGSK